VNDEKHSPAPAEEEAAFWEDEGGDRTITSPFDPPDLRNVPSPVSEPPPALEAETRPELPTRAHDSESTHAVSVDAFFPFAGVGAFPPPPMPSLALDPAPFEDPDRIVVGSDGVGDEPTIAVAAPSPGTSNIAAALAASLGAAPVAPDVRFARGMGGAPGMGSPLGTPLRQPLLGGGVPGAPFGTRDPASGTMTAAPANPPRHPSSAGVPAAPYALPGHGSQPHVLHAPHGPNASWPTSPGALPRQFPPGMSNTMPYGPAAGQAPRAAYAPNLPLPSPAGPAPRSQTLLLAVVGVVCLTIFVLGVVLFLRS
jgi:hypothetical protein